MRPKQKGGRFRRSGTGNRQGERKGKTARIRKTVRRLLRPPLRDGGRVVTEDLPTEYKHFRSLVFEDVVGTSVIIVPFKPGIALSTAS